MNKRSVLIALFFSAIVCCIVNCHTEQNETASSRQTYLNLHDTVSYVGMHQCRLCHEDIYRSFMQTGMGQSFGLATEKKSAASFSANSVLYDPYSDFHYRPFWKSDTLKLLEFRMNNKDTVHTRLETIHYIIGSGQHTNSHIMNTNGYLYQAPFTFYTQKEKLDLPPGYEKGFNSRFSRKIGLECMTCHNAYPGFVKGSENKYTDVPNGITCERCHGPGQLHVTERSKGTVVDTSQYIDYTIVNPARLPIDLQFDVCLRCHLQGNAVLKEGKSFYDFKPGKRLNEVMTVFMPQYEGAEEEFIMASHADRLKMSQCFIKSFNPDAKEHAMGQRQNALTCITCHNPHVSVLVTGKTVFNDACKKCHGGFQHEKETAGNKDFINCISCHMPKSGSIDIPHVAVTDHFIRKPVDKKQAERVRKFIGLYAINEKDPDDATKAEAYMNQFEKFDSDTSFLDSAQKYLYPEKIKSQTKTLSLHIRLYFLKKDYPQLVRHVEKFNRAKVLNLLNNTLWNNEDAWSCYRVGEAYVGLGRPQEAAAFFQHAVKLAPFYPEFKNKLATTLATLGKSTEAAVLFESILRENPDYAPAYSNFGFLYLSGGNISKAAECYNKALLLDPDLETASMNKAGLLILQKKYQAAAELLNEVIRKNPSNLQAKQILEQIKIRN